jgi:type IX secretion system PorP/SprF family membrane protein
MKLIHQTMLACWSILLTCVNVNAQDFHFTQAFNAPQVINPAAVGRTSNERSQVVGLYRGLWEPATHPDAYQGAAVAYTYRRCLRDGFFGAGVTVQHDWSQVGGLFNTLGRLQAAYHIQATKSYYLSAGGYVGLLNYGVQSERLHYDAQFVNGNFYPDAASGEAFSETSVIKADAGAGLELRNTRTNLVAGMAFHHVNRPAYSFFGDDANRLNVGWLAYLSAPVVRKARVQALLRQQSFMGLENRQWQTVVGILPNEPVQIKDFVASGALYVRGGGQNGRFIWANTLTPVLRFGSKSMFINLSYDINLVRLRSRLSGGLEVSWGYSFGAEDSCVRCPRL